MVNLSLLLLAVALVCGCDQGGIKVYSVPKEPAAPMTQAERPADQPAPSPQLKWKTPTNWKELPAGDFRVASFKITASDGKQADVSVIPLPGTAGGDLSNVNRWRGQVGQEPVSVEELLKLAQSVEVAGQSATLYEQSSESTRILAAIQHREGMAWFFKMTGDSQLVAREKSSFVEFLKSVQFGGGAAADGALPAGHPDIAAMPAGTPADALSSEGKPKWDTPSDWKEVPPGQFLVAKFTIAGEGQATVNVSSSVGDGGGLTANVNRWRKQLGLGELTGDEIAKSVKTDGPATFVEMRGQKAALAGAIVSQAGQTWFYKLMGDAPVVAAQQETFVRFVQGAQY